ncbi:MAG: hypothetical protein IK139_05460 [Lachnospiraceae bacterium]|nr:hypothetical protein [Lachnospiraceae bacterium]
MAESFPEGEEKRIIDVFLIASGTVYLFLLDPAQNWIPVGIIVLIIVFLVMPERFNRIKGFLSGGLSLKGARISFSFYLLHHIVICLVFWLLMRLNDSICAIPLPVMCVLAFILSITVTVFYGSIIVKIVEKCKRSEYLKGFWKQRS